MKINRVLQLIRRDLVINKSVIIISIITIAALLFLLNLISPTNLDSVNFHPTMYYFVLFFGGLWVTGLAFRDIFDKQQAYFLLTLPGSNFEKFFCRVFLTSIGYAIGTLIIYTFIYWVIAIFNGLVFRQPILLFNPLNPNLWETILQYLCLQSVFLLGSVYFKTHPLIKTVLTLIILSLAISIFSMLASLFSVSPLFSSHKIIIPDFSNMNISSMADMLYFSFWILIAPFCWWVSFIRFKECEDR